MSRATSRASKRLTRRRPDEAGSIVLSARRPTVPESGAPNTVRRAGAAHKEADIKTVIEDISLDPPQIGPVERGGIGKDDRASGLPEADFLHWTRVLRELPQGRVTEADVLAWIEGPLRQFFPFQRFIGCYGNLSGGRIHMLGFLSSGYDRTFLASLDSTFDLKVRGGFQWWVANRKPFVVDKAAGVDDAGVLPFMTRRSLEEIDRFALGAIAAHGVIDPYMNAGTYFSFSGVPATRPQRTVAALDLIAPVLHTLYLLTKQAAKPAVDMTVLTDRQRELVDLALKGLSDKAIAARLAISDHTVGNHFRVIFAKLGISKRSQLIALLK